MRLRCKWPQVPRWLCQAELPAIQPWSQLCSWQCRLSRRLAGSARHLPSRPAISARHLPSRAAGSACHLPSRPSGSARHLPSRPAGSACHLPSRSAGSACRLARSCLSRRHSFLPLYFDVAMCSFKCACINNASLFADFAVAHGKSIIFLVGDAGDPQQISRSCHHQVELTVTSLRVANDLANCQRLFEERTISSIRRLVHFGSPGDRVTESTPIRQKGRWSRSACRVILPEVGYARRGSGCAYQLSSGIAACLPLLLWERCSLLLPAPRLAPSPKVQVPAHPAPSLLPAPRLAPSPKLQAPAHPAPRRRPNHKRRPLAPVRLNRRLIRRQRPPQTHRRQRLQIF
jgi:hypothetical protein